MNTYAQNDAIIYMLKKPVSSAPFHTDTWITSFRLRTAGNNFLTFCTGCERDILKKIISENMRKILRTDTDRKLHNWHHYSQRNPFVTRDLNVWLGMVSYRLIYPYVFQGCLTSNTYMVFLDIIC